MRILSFAFAAIFADEKGDLSCKEVFSNVFTKYYVLVELYVFLFARK